MKAIQPTEKKPNSHTTIPRQRTAFVVNLEALAQAWARIVATEHLRAHIEHAAVLALASLVDLEESVRRPALFADARDT